MKNNRKKLSSRTLALFAAAILLMSTGGFMGTRAALNAISPNGDATLRTNEIDIDMVDADDSVIEGSDLMGDVDKVIPGRNYDNIVKVKNNAADAYVRVVVTKYWENEKGEKTNEIEPTEIMLINGGKDITGKEWTSGGGWIRSASESTAETDVFYYTKALSTGSVSEPLFTAVRVNEAVLAAVETEETPGEDDNHKTITYTYKYDKYSLCIAAEAQAVQTHSGQQAIKSLWGVDATISGSTITSVSK